jgi:hypothetical protein
MSEKRGGGQMTDSMNNGPTQWTPGQVPTESNPPTAGALPTQPQPGAPPPGPLVPGGPYPPSQSDPILLWIGDIGVSRYWVVTPNGTGPLAGSQWIVRDGTRVEEKMPAYAIVLAVIFFVFCLLGLLFLLIKERRVVGYIEVSVRTGDTYHVAQLPARHAGDVDHVRGMVHQAQSMAYGLG